MGVYNNSERYVVKKFFEFLEKYPEINEQGLADIQKEFRLSDYFNTELLEVPYYQCPSFDNTIVVQLSGHSFVKIL